jgi:hypothetical protein
MRAGIVLLAALLLSGMTCGPQPQPVPVPVQPRGPDTYLFQQHLPDCTVVCIEDLEGEACIELRTLRQFIRGLRQVNENGLAGAGSTARQASDKHAAPTPAPVM